MRANRALVGVVLGMALAVPAPAGAQSGAGVVEAVGVGLAPVEPEDRRSETAVRAAIQGARELALPRAIRAGRERAALLAEGSGLGLGALQGVSEADAGPYGFFFGPYGPQFPTFSNGTRWCGTITVGRYRRDPETRRRRRVGTRRTRTCRYPRQIVTTVKLTYAVVPGS